MRRRRQRGSTTVEYVMLLMLFTIPLGIVIAEVASELVPFYEVVERVHRHPVP